MIEIKGVLRINDDGQVWFQCEDCHHPIVNRVQSPEDAIAGIVKAHLDNLMFNMKETAKEPARRAKEVKAERG